jgi:hypothetical protein
MAATSAMMRGFGAHENVFPQSFMRNAAETSYPGDSLVAMLASSCSNMGSLQGKALPLWWSENCQKKKELAL